jgi:hypothetical protein
VEARGTIALVVTDATADLVHLLQLSISPIALISGVGLLLLSVTNRLARVIDRTRAIAAALRASDDDPDGRQRSQLVVLLRRARLLWLSIAAVTVTVVGSCVMVLLLVGMVFLGLDLRALTMAVFVVAALAMLLSALFFFGDVLLSLRALRVEVGAAWRPRSRGE